jgi:hypothetical protein
VVCQFYKVLTGKDFDHWVLGFEIFFGFMQTLEVK